MNPISIISIINSYTIISPQYAWFNGVDPKAMREVDETELKDVGAELCVEDENMRGVLEWECE